MLDENYIPLDGLSSEPQRPHFPERIQTLIFGFGMQALREEVKLAGGKVTRQVGGGR